MVRRRSRHVHPGLGRREGAGLEPDENGLLHLGTFELAYGDIGRVLVHPETGAVSMVRNGEGPFPSPGTPETFVRLLETVYRFMSACWSPYSTSSTASATS
ncbi:hypothetical protein GCM10017687_24690 [Streptomyces echinatus]|uniref:hypothetical protein n=1 Tax=Streptomyces echinatus TaxID=67293 RepID=UPI003374B73E